MAHSHSHTDSESYYPEQLCLIAFSGLFGGICLSLYFWQQSMLNLLLVKNFHPFVLVSGIVLIGLTLVRAAVLWRTAGEAQPHTHEHGDCGHTHSHDHDCGHEHHHHEHDCGHEHVHSEDCAHHEHAHVHGEDCDHHHEHDCGHAHTHEHAHHDHDHEHGWAPWRYMVLLVPVILFLLGLPNKGPTADASTLKLEGVFTKESAGYASLASAATNLWSQAVLLAALNSDPTAGPVVKIDFQTLEQAAFTDQDAWKGKVVRVVGQFQPSVHSQREFNLIRFRIKCCGADAIPLPVPIVAKEAVTGVQPMQWIDVTGQVEFHKRGENESYFTVLRVPSRKNIAPTEPDANPYIQ